MAKYAVVRFIDESNTPWSVLRRRYLRTARMSQARSTIRCSIIPALKTFAYFLHESGAPRRLSAFEPRHAEDYAVWLSEHFKSPHTIRHKLSVVHSVFEYGIALRDISENPFSNVPWPEAPSAGRYLTDPEIGRFLSKLAQRFRWACELSLNTGMRRAEVVSLSLRWVHGNILSIPANITKNGEARSIILNKRAAALISQIARYRRALRGDPTVRLLGYGEGPLNYHMTQAWKRLRRGRIRFHDMRHNWATRFYFKTRDLRALMDQGGWKHVESVMIYQHMFPARAEGNLEIKYRYTLASR